MQPFKNFYWHEVNGFSLVTTSIWLTRAHFVVARSCNAIVTEFELTSEHE